MPSRGALLVSALLFAGNVFGADYYADKLFEPEAVGLNKSLAVLVDTLTFSKTDTCIATYIGFLRQEGYRVVLHLTVESDPAVLRAGLKELRDTLKPELTGAVFIGKFPLPFSLVEHSNGDTAPFLSMEFYQDLDGDYRPTTFRGVEFAYDNHSGSVESELWTSVLPLIGAPGSDSAMRKISGYFQKNFAFRRKQLQYMKRGHGEPIIGYKTMDTWQTQIDVFIRNRNFNLRGGNLTITKDNSRSDDPRFPDAKYTFETELFGNNFDFVKIGGHGSYYHFTNTEPSILIDMKWADTNAIRPLYCDDGSCNTGEFHSYATGCLATSFLYNPRNNVIIYTAATEYSYGGYQNAEGTWRNVFIDKLSSGCSFGDALLYNFRQQPVNLNNRAREAYTAPRILFGDGTIKLQEFMDYDNNDPPCILRQNQVEICSQAPFSLTPGDFDIRDNDQGREVVSLKVKTGEHYTLSASQQIIPEAGFTGFLTLPVVPNDGVEDGQQFTAVALIDTAEPILVCEKGQSTAVIGKMESDIKQRMEVELPGRLYFYPTRTSTITGETFNEHSVNISARGTDVGEVLFSRKIIEKKDGYTGTGAQPDTRQNPRPEFVCRNGAIILQVPCEGICDREIAIVLYNGAGKRVLSRKTNVGYRRGIVAVNKDDLSRGLYIIEITGMNPGSMQRVPFIYSR